jgi:hypothetical protein
VIRTREPNVDRFIFWTFYPEGCSFIIRNNIFAMAPDIQVFGPVRSTVGHKRTGIGNHTHDHNLYYSPGNTDPIGINKGVGDVIADPLFINGNAGNFRLSPNSPAIGKGIKTAIKEDLDGYPAGKNNGIEMGAFDY